MRKFAKAINTTADLCADFTGIVGQVATPGTSATVTVYEGATDTKTVSAQAMTVKDSLTGLYKYAWDISSVANGAYNAVYVFVSGGFTYYQTEQIIITTKAVDGI